MCYAALAAGPVGPASGSVTVVEETQIGIVYTPWLAGADDVARHLARRLEGAGRVWVCSVPELEANEARASGLSLLVSVGGDGTILRAVRVVAPSKVPLVGVNVGRVGYLTEMAAEEALERIDGYVGGSGWVEERTMLEAQVFAGGREPAAGPGEMPPAHALNDAVVGRGSVARLIFVDVLVDGHLLASYAGDAVIVATATGSTGYALSAGGPVLYPESASLLVKPVAPQLATDTAVVLRPGSVVDLVVRSNDQAMLTLDGFLDFPLRTGDTVRIQHSPHQARFLRSRDPRELPGVLIDRLSSARARERGPQSEV